MFSRTLLSLFFLMFVAGITNASDKNKFVLRNDSVFSNDKFQFRAIARPSKDSSILYSIKSPDEKLQALLMMKTNADTTIFSARFVQLNISFNCKYPAVTIETICESFIRNKVFVNGIAVKEGVAAYCKERNIPVQDIPVRKVERPGMNPQRDSIMRQRAIEMQALKVVIPVKNTSTQQVKIFSGRYNATNPKAMPQGRMENLNPKEEKNIIGFIGEQLCIQTNDTSMIMKDCRPILREMKNMTVAPDGVHFGEK